MTGTVVKLYLRRHHPLPVGGNSQKRVLSQSEFEVFSIHGRTWHIKALMNLQLKCVLDWLEAGHICKAIRKDDNVKFDRKECENG